jgi:hypothetical protein
VSGGDREGPPVGEEPGDLILLRSSRCRGESCRVGGSGQTDLPLARRQHLALRGRSQGQITIIDKAKDSLRRKGGRGPLGDDQRGSSPG